MAEDVKKEEEQAEKPLDKMTVVELREVIKDEVPDMTGLSSMKKDQLLEAIKDARNSEDETPAKETTAKKAAPKKAAPKKAAPKKTAPKKTAGSKKEMTVKEMKQEVVKLRAEREEIRKDGDKKKLEIIRRSINRLKKMTRKAA
jgi:topoisomerase IA-like protein